MGVWPVREDRAVRVSEREPAPAPPSGHRGDLRPASAWTDDARPSRVGAVSGAVVVGVVGAVGGVGTSTFAAVLAARIARRTATVLVDLDPVSAGVDLLLGLEQVSGARWPDLAGARGAVDGRQLLDLLPRWGRCAVLGPSVGAGAGAPEVAVVDDVLAALARECGAVVVDLGRAGDVACDVVLLVAPRTLAGVTGALRARPDSRAALVVRARGGLGTAEVARTLALPVAAVLRDDRRLARGVEHGGLRADGRVGRAARTVAAALERGARW